MTFTAQEEAVLSIYNSVSTLKYNYVGLRKQFHMLGIMHTTNGVSRSIPSNTLKIIISTLLPEDVPDPSEPNVPPNPPLPPLPPPLPLLCSALECSGNGDGKLKFGTDGSETGEQCTLSRSKPTMHAIVNIPTLLGIISVIVFPQACRRSMDNLLV
eukprot:TRINITY_DN27258_c0_g1_i1.p1 TRINITY_DN27258_c0_g1~~TRINITY_DN27258_c0_g1_i1.p1  ORF type:complete len:156 (+),score=8.90 TRINITY_DN27258_c0_g1_i1:57-524(+)